MNFIRIKNLRSLRDTNEIEMKKINVLVGSNSSGKSTFLRVFPLLKQSLSKRINGPVLWCGDDDDYVDFGSFEEALNYNVQDNDDTISFVFDFFADYTYLIGLPNNQIHIRKLEGEVKTEFAVSHNKKTIYDYVSKLILSYNDYILEAEISEKNSITMFSLNGNPIDITEVPEEYYDYISNEGMFDISFKVIMHTAREKIIELLELSKNERDMFRDYVACLYAVFDKNDRLPEENEIYRRALSEIKKNPHKMEELEKWLFLYELPRFFESISDYLTHYFLNVYYIAPVRATAERYYKLRNLAVDEVDCRGKNLPVFLNSLRKKSFSAFQKWTQENLGFMVYAFVSEGHVSLKIQKEGQAKAVNLSDAGFGYSQILPIITQLWYIAAGVRKTRSVQSKYNISNTPKTIVIEQPELHLHPALQAKLIDIIAKIAREENIYFIIETHSETMVNRIGNLIGSEKITHDDVGIVIFNKKFSDDETQIMKSSFDEDGYLRDWPIGFFEPEEE